MKPGVSAVARSASLLAELEDISAALSSKSYFEISDSSYRELARNISEDALILKNMSQYFKHCHIKILNRIEKDILAYRSSAGELLKK